MITMKMIQVRNVPDDVHRRLKVRAAEQGITLSQLVYEAVIDYAERPTWDDFWMSMEGVDPVDAAPGTAAELIRRGRADRGLPTPDVPPT